MCQSRYSISLPHSHMSTTAVAEATTALDVGYISLSISTMTFANVLSIRFISNCCTVAAGGKYGECERDLCDAHLYSVLYYYDRCLTFSTEFELIWSRHDLSLATGLYLLTQASMAAYQVLNIIDMAVTGCEVINLPYILQTLPTDTAI